MRQPLNWKIAHNMKCKSATFAHGDWSHYEQFWLGEAIRLCLIFPRLAKID
jgi:hypothetical protein